ncbi:hypothetical protein C4D60_Mb08t09470 [Musa balbisiana]|uniref:Uncharacterized protein n=1 Tax=Musa balbisiana TaxID=52838 RepID=A0A4S8K2L5_MUSBA|nr:hypothetical protein C4D60_Mb08t09470 [Musa balbisiana]
MLNAADNTIGINNLNKKKEGFSGNSQKLLSDVDFMVRLDSPGRGLSVLLLHALELIYRYMG